MAATGLARRNTEAKEQPLLVRKAARRKKDSNIVWFWGNDCKYEVITDKVDSIGWKIVDDEKKETKCNLFWVDVSTIHERLRSVSPWQMVNHFPGMTNIARKNRMGQNLNKFQKTFPREFSFYPKTWVLPHELSDFRSQFDNSGNSIGGKVFILKPDAGCQGKGIFLTKTWDNVPLMDNWVAQVYMKKPLLIDGFKFDLRIYVFVTCVKPLRMYMFKDGLVRMCCEEYVKPTKANIHMTQMHLTNYAINKSSANFQQPGEANADDGSKRALAWFLDWVRDDWGEDKADKLWKRIGNITVKTVLTILPTLSREYEAGYKSFNQVPLVRPSPPKPAGTEDPAIAEIEEAPTAVGTATNAPALTAENLAALESAENEDKEGAEEEEDGSDGESAEGVGGVPGSCATKLDKNLIYRGSRCFEVLGLDIMIDSKLNPWMIEVNHLPSFGTDSPLDLDIKERLMDEVFNCLPVLPDDEMAYNLHHKAEAEKRLTVERTTASITKMRDKASVEKEREQKEEKERQERVKRRRQRDALYMASQRTLSEERKLVGIPDQVNGLHPQKICITQNKEPTYHQLPRIDQIKFHLKEIYIEKCPDKLNKIDRLLERYETREEEFLTFVCEKYGVTITVPELLQEEDVAEEYPDGVDPDEGEEEDRGRSRDVPGSHSRESSRAADDERSRSVSLDRLSGDKANDKVEKKHSSSVPPVKSAQGPEPPLGTKAGARFGSRSLSPPASTSRRASQWKGGDDEELFKLEVVQQHVPEELDPWMQREMRILKSFTRIFPPEVKQGKSVTDTAVGDGVAAELSKDKDDKDVAEGSDGEDSDDGEDRDEEENETPSAPPTTKPGAAAAAHLLVAHEKKKLASFNDILVEAFLQDRRQTLRLRGPLAHQSRPEKDGNSLPELNSKAAWGSTKASKSSPGAHGWKPPAKPTEGEKKKSDKPGPSQAEVANRLYKGLSSTSPHAAAAASMLSNGSVLAESSMADSLVGHGGGINMDIGGSSGDGLNSYGSVYSSAPQQQGIAFGGAPNVAMGYAPNGSITSASGGPSGGYQQRQSRFVKQNTQPKPGSLWGSTGNYVLDSSPGTSYVPAQFRGHSIADFSSAGRPLQPAPPPAATLRQQVFQFSGSPTAQPRQPTQYLSAGAGLTQIQPPNAGGLGILGNLSAGSTSDKYRSGASSSQPPGKSGKF